MATILLSAAGAAVGSGFGGSVLGLSGAVIGRAIGATAGRLIDQRVLGQGSQSVETGRIERFRITGASYGSPVQEIWGRMRVAGQVIWASRFQEHRLQSGAGKGSPRTTSSTFSYSVSIAIALCTGEAQCVGRIWADGIEIPTNSLNLRFYPGSEDQLPDPKIEAVEGAGLAPSYRGICYIVIEDLDLSRFGNRVPQFSFEVVRNARGNDLAERTDLSKVISAVALIPGTGEYSLATSPVHFSFGPGRNQTTNVHSIQGATDFSVSVKQLQAELPNCRSVSLVVSWFGDDLRCSHCAIRPKVEQVQFDGVEMPWLVNGIARTSASIVPSVDGTAIYGGTPCDRSVIQAIQALRDAGQEVMFYPFILLDQQPGNALPDPWSSAASQPSLPWRGRITLNKAPGQAGTTDQTPAAAAEVAAFLGSAAPADFVVSGQTVTYTGPAEWSFRRFILHYAYLCAAAGGVDSFCIGSELRGLTQIRSSTTVFPMVQGLKVLAAEVKSILGASTKVAYAADWSEYFGLQSGNDVLFHLDPLWSDSNIDFVGIDNYMPISDWREGMDHLDAAWGSIYNPDYLAANIAGGEGFDWYYDSEESIEDQRRTPILDTRHGEDWVFRYKDIKSWWENSHFNRLAGVRQSVPTEWVPGSKPIRFTEFGCAALDRATNEPNRFLDTNSSESGLPRDSDGHRDDFIQLRYFQAMARHWGKVENNPISPIYNEPMVDFSRSHAWAWDARPFPEFPANAELWADGENYDKGHWLNGRSSNQQISTVIEEICAASGIDENVDASKAFGVLRGYVSDTSQNGRAKLQALSVAYGILSSEVGGTLEFRSRQLADPRELDLATLAVDRGQSISKRREAASQMPGSASVTYVASESDFEIQSALATYPDERNSDNLDLELGLELTVFEASALAERVLSEARSGLDQVAIFLPPSARDVSVGDEIALGDQVYRVESLEDGMLIKCDMVRLPDVNFSRLPEKGDRITRSSPSSSTPVFPVFLDLPLISGEEVPYAPRVAVAAAPWPGPVSVWNSPFDSDYTLNTELGGPAVIGITGSELFRAPSALIDHGSVLTVEISTGELSSASLAGVLSGANLAAIGDGTPGNWEIIQFTNAALVAPSTYVLTDLIRGIGGTDATAPSSWPIGSLFVLLDSAVPQISHPLANRGLSRFYRVGQSALGYADANVVTRQETFNAIGLRPFSVSRLSVWQAGPGADLHVSWIRRTRIDGDSWSSVEVPVGEESEAYLVQIVAGSTTLREEHVTTPSFTYTPAMAAVDGVTVPFLIRVAQVSAIIGAGPGSEIQVDSL